MIRRIGEVARARLGSEDGFTITELMVALVILSIAFFALAGAASIGLRIVAEGKQRDAATEIANGRLEHLRNIPYDKVALNGSLCSPSCSPTHSSDPNNPDYEVTADNLQFDPGTGTNEDLVIDETSGEVPHIESPVAVGPILYSVYQYVTWVDDPVGGATPHDYKRLTVVASFNTPVNTGRPRKVAVSALFTPAGIVISGDTAGATVGSTTTPTPTPTPTPTASCGGDDNAPTGDFTLLSGAGAVSGYTASTNVTIKPSPIDSCTPITMKFSNDNTTYGSDVVYDSTNPSVTWTVASGDGTKSIWAKFRDGRNNQATFGPHSIILDQTKPTTPGTLADGVSCSGSSRTVTLSWGSSTDTNFLGYRVYKSTNGGIWTSITTTSTLTTSDTDAKTLDSVSYEVVGYDKAGNESAPTNAISLSKNKCS
ncbi:MAG: prepilin-type N-terminal cleavage/methylation domain-containing protein [Actinomycetota bacterium]